MESMQNLEEEWIRIRSGLEQAKHFSTFNKVAAWRGMGSPLPPPSAYKQELIKAYADRYKTPILVETGTYLGEMVKAGLPYFKEIYSVELSQELYQNASNKFKGAKSVKLYNGDSGEMLQKIIKKVKKPALFWLDAHYSAGVTAKGDLNTPIVKELETIFSAKNPGHIILIDDARVFDGTDDYPTINQLKKLMHKLSPDYGVVVRNDVIRLQLDDSYIDV